MKHLYSIFDTLNESKDFKMIDRRALTKVERHHLSLFIEFLRDIITIPKGDALAKYANDMQRYRAYEFAAPLFTVIDAELSTRQQARAALTNRDKVYANAVAMQTTIIQQWENGDVTGSLLLADKLRKANDTLAMGGSANAVTALKNPYFKKDNPFSRTKVYTFDQEDLVALSQTDPAQVFTSIPFKIAHQPFAYIVQSLRFSSNKETPLRLDPNMYQDYFYLKYKDNAAYQNILNLMQKYVRENSAASIQSVLTALDGLPELRELNERSKRGTKLVYRGIALDDSERYSSADILKMERERQFVATTKREDVAMAFAQNRDVYSNERGTERGFLITYQVSPQSIIFDNALFGTTDDLYGEGEYIINPQAAKILKIIHV